MSKTGRKVAAALVAVVGVCALFGVTACNKDKGGKDETQYTVTYVAGADDAYGDTQTASYKKGEKFNLLAADTFERDGYTFTAWNDGTADFAAGAEYTMPEKDVTFTANWQEYIEPLPEGTETIQSFTDTALTLTERSAKSHWEIAYGESALKVTVNVEDSGVYSAGKVFQNDGIEVRVSKVQRVKGYSDGAIAVTADVKGRVEVKNLKTTATVPDSGVTAQAKYLTLDGVRLAGYRITLEIPYACTEITAAEKDAALAVTLTNASNAVDARTVSYTALGTDKENVHTWFALTDDNAYAANPDVIFAKNWGNAGSMKASSVWNVDSDDDSQDAHIFMEGVDYQDNYIYLYKSNVKNMYAEAKIAVKEAVPKSDGGEYDEWPKFGLTMTTTDGQTGFFYYVDAPSNKDTGAINSNAVNLGINKRTGGGWDGSGWTGIGKTVGADSSVYQGENYITLGIYREGGVFKLTRNGEAIATYTCGIKDNDIAYVGLASFNLKLDVKDYSIKTDADTLDKYKVQNTTIDHLFIGDSYVDTRFWYSYENQFGSLSAANMGVGSTQIGYWTGMVGAVKALYTPANIVVHIGVNDIDDGNTTGEEAITRLERMLDVYHEAFPEAKIYYITVEHNMKFPEKWEEYDKLNAWARAQTKTRELFDVIDMAEKITADADGSTQYWFGSDGLHYDVDGYGLWNREICKALGITERVSSNGFGDVTAEDAPAFSYTAGWEISADGVAHNAGNSFGRIGAESQLYLSDAYAANVYAEVEVSAAKCYCATDNLPKLGIAIRNERGTWFFAIDAQNGNYANDWANLLYRPENYSAGWHEEFKAWQNIGGAYRYANGEFTKLVIAKYGTDLHLFGNNGRYVNSLYGVFGENEKVAVSVFTFNMDMYAKNAVVLTGDEAVTKLNSLKVYERVEGKAVDGDMSDWTAEETKYAIRIPATDGRSVTVYATLRDDGLYLFYDAIHNTYKTSDGAWYNNTNLEFRLACDMNEHGAPQRFASADGQMSRYEYWVTNAEKNEWANSRQVVESKFVSVKEGEKQHTKAEVFVPYMAIDNLDKTSANVMAGFAWKTGGENDTAWANGDFWYVPEADPGMRNVVVTHSGIKGGNAHTIDGDLSGWTLSAAGANEGITAKMATLYNDEGLFVALELKSTAFNVTATNRNDGWWQNTNIEIRAVAANYEPVLARIMTYNGNLYHTGRVSSAAMKYVPATEEGGEATLSIEFFIASEILSQAVSVGDGQLTIGRIAGQIYGSAATNTYNIFGSNIVVTKTVATE